MPGSTNGSRKPPDRGGQRQTSLSLIDWAPLVMDRSGQSPAQDNQLLLDHLNRVSRGEIDRLMVLMPPGSAKSTYASILFPAWWFVQHPESAVIATSHTTSLAEHFGRQVREVVK